MKHCPAPACPFATRFRRPAEYGDQISVCIDCGAALRDGPAPLPEAPAPAPPLPPVTRGMLLRGLLSLAVAAVAVGAAYVALPGGDPAAWLGPGEAGDIGILAIGLGPLLLGFGLVEAIAALIPRLRPLRYSGPRGRSPLVVASLACGLALGLVMVAQATPTLGDWLAADPRLLALALILAPAALYGLARVVDRFGIGGGLPLVVAALVIPGVVGHLIELAGADEWAPVEPVAEAALACSALLLVLPGWLATRDGADHPAWLRWLLPPTPLARPVTGATPLQDLLLPVALLTPLAAILGRTLELPDFLFSGWPKLVPHLLAVGAAALLVGWLYNRPRNVAAVLHGLGVAGTRRGETEATLRRALARALALSVAIVILAELAWFEGARRAGTIPLLAELATLLAVSVDLAAEWRARRLLGPLRRAWALHRTYAAAPVLAALAREGVPAHIRGRQLRTLVPFLGSWAPMDVLVRPADAERAAAFLAARLGSNGRLSRESVLDALS